VATSPTEVQGDRPRPTDAARRRHDAGAVLQAARRREEGRPIARRGLSSRPRALTGRPSSGAHIEVEVMDVVRSRDGKIVEH